MRSNYGQLSHLINRYGLGTTRRGLVYLAQAAIFVQATGEDPSPDAVSAYWKESERTSWRGLAAFRKISDGLDLEETARIVVATYSAQVLDAGSVTALAFDLGDFVQPA